MSYLINILLQLYMPDCISLNIIHLVQDVTRWKTPGDDDSSKYENKIPLTAPLSAKNDYRHHHKTHVYQRDGRSLHTLFLIFSPLQGRDIFSRYSDRGKKFSLGLMDRVEVYACQSTSSKVKASFVYQR
ncbi:hypothetical protein NPIL_479251 [Nephila pilipes]|uniref:Uncharacterized protein n=1 Tax=Nephila pilipes TaxID=299642 RepID=A0A8X6Q4E1_NEPPI|nr:hypothetical protein NPIL_479251 [Nephila pilipes]